MAIVIRDEMTYSWQRGDFTANLLQHQCQLVQIQAIILVRIITLKQIANFPQVTLSHRNLLLNLSSCKKALIILSGVSKWEETNP